MYTYTHTQTGEQEVAVTGSQTEIGNWQADGALKLQTNKEE
jgi:hypothetical protein